MRNALLSSIRRMRPLVHCITNAVTVNDCANLLLAAGASPAMADTPEEMAEMVTLAQALVVNIGTLSPRTRDAMFRAAAAAKELGRPSVLDPVGAGASKLRTETAIGLLKTGAFTVVRGNISECRALAGESFTPHGVDASEGDLITEETLPEGVNFARRFARRFNVIVSISGVIDVVSNGAETFCIRNGCPMMARITGSGCMLSALTAAFLAADPTAPLEGAAAAVSTLGCCGEIARDRLAPGEGCASYRIKLIDAVSLFSDADWERMADIESL